MEFADNEAVVIVDDDRIEEPFYNKVDSSKVYVKQSPHGGDGICF